MRCSDLDALGVPYVDGETAPTERVLVEQHLERCPPCRRRLDAERAARDVLRAGRDRLREPAPAGLRMRCERAGRADGAAAGRAAPRLGRWMPTSLGAAAVLSLAIVWIGRVDAGTGVLAAQVTLDHIKCATFNAARVTGSAAELAAYWRRLAGWPIVVPAVAGVGDLQLAGIRRCASSEGATAHIMYSYRGRPVSLFVARDDAPRTTREFDLLGHETVVWSADRRTYLLVGDAPRDEIQALAAVIRKDTLRKDALTR